MIWWSGFFGGFAAGMVFILALALIISAKSKKKDRNNKDVK